MSKKSSAYYQREFRRRLREKGLVKKEVWIRPEYAKQLAALERRLRDANGLESEEGVTHMIDAMHAWTTSGLYAALKETELFSGEEADLELIEGVEPSLHMVLHEYGDLPVFLTVAGEQIVVEAILWPVDDVIDRSGFNEAVLRTHKYFPLSTVSLDTSPDGTDYYHMFGALSSTAILPNVVFEIEVLASNVIQATEAYAEFLNTTLAT